MAAYGQVVEELHKPARRRYPRRKFDLREINETYQIDLVDMQTYSDVNRGFKYLLTVIDVFSEYAWAIPIKNKSAEEVTKAMDTILTKDRHPKKIQADQGTEFFNSCFTKLLKKYNIHLYYTFSNLKASIIERFNRTLKSMMWKKFTLNGNYKWIDLVSDLVDRYNDTKHRTIQMKPKDVSEKHEKTLLRRYKAMEPKFVKKARFKIGDKVRVSKIKHVFEKGYTPNYTTEIFTITKVKKTKPVTYLLKDYQDNPITGCFYEQELCKTKYPDVYIVEKIIRRRSNKLYVKWLGFSNPSWINKKDLE